MNERILGTYASRLLRLKTTVTTLRGWAPRMTRTERDGARTPHAGYAPPSSISSNILLRLARDR